jgi:hypothetical protein
MIILIFLSKKNTVLTNFCYENQEHTPLIPSQEENKKSGLKRINAVLKRGIL